MSGDRLQKLILVADDDADVRELVVFRLERAGYEVITAGTGRRRSPGAGAPPDLCVIDVMMPKLDGYEVTELLRASEELPGSGSCCSRRASTRRR